MYKAQTRAWVDPTKRSVGLLGVLSMGRHIHRLAYVGRLQGEYGGSYELRWCSDCGALYEIYSGGKIYEVLPEMNREEFSNCKAKFLKRTIPYSKVPAKVLGRGLKDLEKTTKSSNNLIKLLGGIK